MLRIRHRYRRKLLLLTPALMSRKPATRMTWVPVVAVEAEGVDVEAVVDGEEEIATARVPEVDGEAKEAMAVDMAAARVDMVVAPAMDPRDPGGVRASKVAGEARVATTVVPADGEVVELILEITTARAMVVDPPAPRAAMDKAGPLPMAVEAKGTGPWAEVEGTPQVEVATIVETRDTEQVA